MERALRVSHSRFTIHVIHDLSEAFVHLGPVHHVPPRGEVVGATVLILQVVGVLPDVGAEDRRGLAVHQRVVLVR